MYIGYYFYPEEQLSKVRKAGIPSLWIMGGKEIESIYPEKDEIHIDAYWRYGDASVWIPGYDIKIAPASGVIMTAALWLCYAATAQALKNGSMP